MNKLEKSKERLRNAFMRIEAAISSKLARMQLENQMLREELVKLQQKKTQAPSASRRALKEGMSLRLEETFSASDRAKDEVSLSIKELKKLVG